MIVNEYDLGREGREYLDDFLDIGQTLSPRLKRLLPLDESRIFSVLPYGDYDERIYLERYGFPNAQRVPSPRLERRCDVNAIDHLACLLKDAMLRYPGSVCVCEDEVSRPTKALVDADYRGFVIYGDNIVQFCTAPDESELKYLVLWSGCAVHELGVVTHISELGRLIRGNNISEAELEEIAVNTKFLYVMAFDGEGYAYWERG